MKKYLFNIALAIVCAAILIAVGFNAVSGQVTVEEKQSSFKLTDFDFIVRSPSKAQIAEFDNNDTAVKAIFPCYEMEVNCTSASTSPKLNILFSDDMDDYGISLFNEKTLVSGAFDKSGLMLDEKAAQKLKVSVGDSVSLALMGRSFTYRVAAIYRESTYNTLDNGLGLVEFTSELTALYENAPRKISYTLAFIDAENVDTLAAELSTYKPLGSIRQYEDFIKDYNRNPALTDEQWNAHLESEYQKYYAEKVASLKAAGNVERKSDYMQDVVDRIETTQHKVDALTVGIALAAAVVFTLTSAVILYLGKNNDLILAREGAEKSHLIREKLAVNFTATIFVALVSFAVIFGFASSKGFVNETIGAVMLCSLPVLVNIPVSFVAVKLYVDGIYGKAEMASEDDGMLRLDESYGEPLGDADSSTAILLPAEDAPNTDAAAVEDDLNGVSDISEPDSDTDNAEALPAEGDEPEANSPVSTEDDAKADTATDTEPDADIDAGEKNTPKDANGTPDDSGFNISVSEGELGTGENPAE